MVTLRFRPKRAIVAGGKNWTLSLARKPNPPVNRTKRVIRVVGVKPKPK
ncbi:Uncharacterised protein [uncultured archaeon]|nr:Uncharacterised protein [uncultured archaeon]